MSYTTGETRALIAPLFDQDPDNVVHYTIVAHTKDHKTVYTDSHAAGVPEPTSTLLVAFTLLSEAQDMVAELLRHDGTEPPSGFDLLP